MKKITQKFKNNIRIYKQDLQSKGLYWSVVHRLYKIIVIKRVLSPIVNALKPDYVLAQNHKYYIDKKDSIVSEVLLSRKVWEEYETEVFKESIKQGATVVDVGAHIGYYTLIAASIVGNKGKVYAFEPDPGNFRLLQKNVAQSGYTNVVLINKAVTQKSGKTLLFLNKENMGDHRIYDVGEGQKSISIETVALDDYFKKLTKIDVIKMDIQGAEVQALKGAEDILKRSNHIKLILEFMPSILLQGGSSAEECLSFLKKNRFKLYRLDESKKKMTFVTPGKLLDLYAAKEDFLTNLLCLR